MQLRAKCYWCGKDIKLQDDAHFVLHQNLADLINKEPFDHEAGVTAMCTDCYVKMTTMFSVIGNLPTGSVQYTDVEAFLKSIGADKNTQIPTESEESVRIIEYAPEITDKVEDNIEHSTTAYLDGLSSLVESSENASDAVEDKSDAATSQEQPEESNEEKSEAYIPEAPNSLTARHPGWEVSVGKAEASSEATSVKKSRGSQLSKETMDEILVKKNLGISALELAAEYHIHVSTVHRAVAKYKENPYEIGEHGILELKCERGKNNKNKKELETAVQNHEELKAELEANKEPEVTQELEPEIEVGQKQESEVVQEQESESVPETEVVQGSGNKSEVTQEQETKDAQEVKQPEKKIETTARMGRPPKHSANAKEIAEEEKVVSKPYSILQQSTSTSPEEMSLRQRVLRMSAQNIPAHIIASRLGIPTDRVEKTIESHRGNMFQKLNAKFNIKCADMIYTLWKAKWSPDMIRSEVDLDTAVITAVIKEIKRV